MSLKMFSLYPSFASGYNRTMAKKNAINTAIIFTLCSLIFTLDIAIFIVSVAHYTFIQKHALWTIIYSSSDNYMVTFSILREKSRGRDTDR